MFASPLSCITELCSPEGDRYKTHFFQVFGKSKLGVTNVKGINFCLFLIKKVTHFHFFNPKRAGGGGGIRPPLDVSRGNFVEIFFRAASFDDFFLSSLAQLLALFSEKSGVRFQSYATLCNRASAQNVKIFWICVQNVWKMASCAKTPFWALKCSICFHYS